MTPRIPQDDRLTASLDLVRRTGAQQAQLRWSDDEEPVVWMAVAVYHDGVFEAAAGRDPFTAAYRLVEQLVDGSKCVHCRRPAGVSDDWTGTMPLEAHVCWYRYDPELKTFRRSCEGESKINRNDPCPCGSGTKFKNCHGNPRGTDQGAS